MKKLIITLLILLITSTAFSQSGWFQQQSGTSRKLNDVYFVNSNTGWVVGDSTILKTINSGLNWSTQSLPVQSQIKSVHFINAFTGYAVGDQ